MVPRLPALVLASVIACGSPQRSTLSRAGDDRDDGAGELAQASLQLSIRESTPGGFGDDRSAPSGGYEGVYGHGGSMYGGGMYGGDPYGGAGYAGWSVPQWQYTPALRTPTYAPMSGLAGAIEGTVTWQGPPPAKQTSACGPIDHPTLRVGNDRAVRGVIVYIERVTVGRTTPYYARPAAVGGTLAKRGCALVPAAQIVAPLPGALSVHGDEQRTKIRLVHDKDDRAKVGSHELQEAGLVQIEAKAGVTRVESVDGKLAPAWVLGLDTPYYAITDDAGRYRLDELAPGTYEVTFWQPPVATAKPDGTWTHGAPIVVKRSVRVGGRPTQLSVVLGR